MYSTLADSKERTIVWVGYMVMVSDEAVRDPLLPSSFTVLPSPFLPPSLSCISFLPTAYLLHEHTNTLTQ